ncbi:PUA-like domain-containing protein [Chytriomyces sp. MP71]|nr:PUA-like domain-containing protein [Chytriomyces sp. MP71]
MSPTLTSGLSVAAGTSETTRRYWIGVVSHNHVRAGVAGGFAQLCHGRHQPLQRMNKGDVLIYYSPKTDMKAKGVTAVVQSFTAIGKVVGDAAYAQQVTPAFAAFRRDVDYDKNARPVPIKQFLARLSFIQNLDDPKKWGMLFRRAHFDISREDFLVIAQAMGSSYE